MAWSITLAVLGLSVLVIVHESGHYLIARAFGMRVVKFAVGFGPAIVKWKPPKSETTFQVGLIPLLAYVQVAGMNPQDDVDAKDPALFPNQSLLARILTIAGGPAANYLAASALVFVIALSGWPEPTGVGVIELTPASPAAAAGLRPGDVIVEANGRLLLTRDELIAFTSARAGQPTRYVVVRGGRQLPPITITPELREGRGIIGVLPVTQRTPRHMGVGEAAVLAIAHPVTITVESIKGLLDMIKRGSTKEVGGPVKMVQIMATQASRGSIDYLLTLVFISVALGFFNLLPLPALDGGRLMFLAYELITRRRPNERFEAVVHTVGLLLLLSVLVLVTYRDLAE